MSSEYVWLDAAEFDDFGEWKLDSQFAHLMGVPYLLACHQPGVPVKDAKATVHVNKNGIYRVWVRTKNWYHPYAPGQFTVKVNGAECSANLGTNPTHDWYWHLAGDFTMGKGENQIDLCDKTGYFGRMASILFTDDMDFVPARPVAEFEKQRAEIKGIDLTPKHFGDYDVVVAGAGPGGVPAAVAAARHGAKTLLISGRPVVGGNASSEAGVGFNGASSRQVNAREGGIGEEIVRGRFHRKNGWTPVLEDLCDKEENLTVIYNYFVCGAKKDGEKIQSITAKQIVDGTYITVGGKQFIDCTGDGWMGYYAKAKYRLGREAKWQFDEEFAPDVADTCTMSGCAIGGYKGEPVFKEIDHEVPFTAPEWVPQFPKGEAYGRNIERIGFAWWLEAPNILDDLYDAEMARDELLRINIGHFNYLKNLWDDKEKAKNYVMWRMPYYDAKRESRRFVGDYILTQNDCMQGRDFEDTVSHTGWPIDLHNPKGIYSGKEGPFFSNTHIPMTKVPFRCLYSANVENLLFAGRCASISHIALGTCRIQNTIACEGQAVGTAAALCAKEGITPRDIYKNSMKEFQQLLIKDDQYIPGLVSTDEMDIARRAIATASSVSDTEYYTEYIGVEAEGYELDKQRATFFARDVADHVGSVWTKLTNKTDHAIDVTFYVREQADPDGYVTKEDLRVVTVKTPAHSTDWYEIKIDVTTKLRYLWMWADKTPGIWWHIWFAPPLDYTRSERNNESETFENIRWESHCVLLNKPVCEKADCGPQNVINGYSRIKDARHYEWVSDDAQGLPQWIELQLDKKQSINSVYLTFDSDMTNPAMLQPYYDFPLQLVKAYQVEVFDGTSWIKVADEKDNYLRRRIHRFDSIQAEKVKVTVTDSGDGKTARIFEIRLYQE